MQKILESKSVRALVMLMVMAVFNAGYVSVANAELIPSGKTQISQERAQDMTTVRQALESKVVTERLSELGFSEQEVDQRLAMLTDQEVSQLSNDIQNVDTAGSVIGAVAGVAVVLIIVLAILEITGDADNF